MRITDIETIPLRGKTPKTGWDHEVDPGDDIQALIKVSTDGGIEGFGSVFTSQALVEASLQLLKPLVIGECALEPERVSEKLHQMTFWQGRGGAVTHTISGIDMALWDILGKQTGQSVGRLLGGVYRDRIKPYGSVLFDEPGRLKETLASVVERGFRSIKLGWRPFGRHDRKKDEELVRAAREAVGDDVEIMVDAGGSEQFWPHTLKWAIETATMLADYDVVWFEEPLSPDFLADFKILREKSPVMIATGEVFTRRQSFIPWIEQGAVDILQPDCSKVGGLSEARKIASYAYDHGILTVPHGWNNAVGLAADLQLVASLPVARWVEYITPSPYIDDIVSTPFKLDDEGMLEIPNKPGLGIELDDDALESLRSIH